MEENQKDHQVQDSQGGEQNQNSPVIQEIPEKDGSTTVNVFVVEVKKILKKKVKNNKVNNIKPDIKFL